MGKELSEMTLEELWQLFPIFLTQHQDYWEQWYLEEKNRILCFLPIIEDIRINHIGSTSIKSIWAKPIIDILVEIPEEFTMDSIKEGFTVNGYICMSETEKRMDFNRGYTADGFAERVFHLHLRYLGDNDELYFRDFMNANPVIAKQYEDMKLSLWERYEHDRDAYTNAKGQFISECTEKAKKEYPDRYPST